MIKLILLLVILFFGLLFGHTLIGVEGRIIIALPETVVELSVISALIIGFFAVVLFWILEWAFKKLFRTVSGSRNWFGALSRRQQNKAFHNSLHAMLLNEPDEALKYLRKTMNGDFQGTNALIAAELEAQAGNTEQAQAYLIKAADEATTQPIAIMKQAQLALSAQKPEEAMTLLSAVEGKYRSSKAFVMLKLNILAALQDWPQIQSIASANKKLLADDYVTWASQCVRGEFAAIASKQGANALKEHWASLSRGAKKDEANQVVYTQLLIDQGLYNDAESALVQFASKHSHISFWPLFKQLKMPQPTQALKFIEQEIKKQPLNADLFSVLGHLAYNSDNFELAHKAIKKALELRDSHQDKALLAKILESTQDYQAANVLYQGLVNP